MHDTTETRGIVVFKISNPEERLYYREALEFGA